MSDDTPMADLTPERDGDCDECGGVGCIACDARFHRTPDAPWREGPLPDIRLADHAELHVAGALSTMPPFDKYHPAEALPFAVMALRALGNLDLDGD